MAITQEQAVKHRSDNLATSTESWFFSSAQAPLFIRRLLIKYLKSISTDHWTIGQSSLGLRIRYICNHRNSNESKTIKLHWRILQKEIWIDYLHLPPNMRGNGLGSRIVREVFCFANELGASTLVVMPLLSAIEFWQKNGFQPHPRKSRILQRFVLNANYVNDLRKES